MSVVYGLGISTILALAWIAIPWRKVFAAPRPTRRDIPTRAIDNDALVPRATVRGEGFYVVANSSLDVSAKTFANGSTQVWLKRRPL